MPKMPGLSTLDGSRLAVRLPQLEAEAEDIHTLVASRVGATTKLGRRAQAYCKAVTRLREALEDEVAAVAATPAAAAAAATQEVPPSLPPPAAAAAARGTAPPGLFPD